ncbi:AAA family ATPase [Algicola sagamiensis]|uniref:AAA family ATPase n=1 Tax=Algicola sagamiensis TaxID=163869 RepID=UPI0003705EC4|nr:SMC family ATPase [Algicola sagamiensis]
MKPYHLSLQAFGPFPEQEAIDFTRLGQHPLFLINGATGAGKSTILDAICFALYGQTTGNERDGMQMRCDQANSKMTTEVTLVFEIAGRLFKIKRSPIQEKAKSRGTGTTQVGAKAQLWQLEDDGTEKTLIVAKSVSEANQEIRNLIGLDAAQFRQVMVLPQGKFRELLLADSKDREKIFSQLFQTQVYARIESLLKVKAADIKKAVETYHHQQSGILQSIALPDENALNDALNALKPEHEISKRHKASALFAFQQSTSRLEQAKHTLSKYAQLDEYQTTLQQKQLQAGHIQQTQMRLEKIQSALQLLPKYQQIRQLDQENLHLKQSYEGLLLELEAAMQQASSTVSQLEQAKINANQLPELEKQLIQATSMMQQAEHLDEKAKQEQQYKTQLGQSEKEVQQLEETLHTYQSQAMRFNDQLIEAENAIAILPGESLKLEALVVHIKQKKELEKLRQQQKDARHNIQKATAQLRQQQLAIEEASRHCKQTEMNWHQSQAALLAEQLEDDLPCPVCGSNVHPEPAQRNQHTFTTKSQVDAARETLKAYEEAERQSLIALKSLESQDSHFQQDIERRLSQCGESETPSIETLAQEKQQITEKIQQLQLQGDTKDSLCRQLLTNQQHIDTTTQQVEARKQQLEQYKILHYKLSSEVTTLRKQLPEQYQNKVQFTQHVSQLEQQIKHYKTTLEQANHAQQQAEICVEKHKANLALTVENSKKTAKRLNQCQADWQSALVNSPFNDEVEFFTAEKDFINQETLQSKVDNYKQVCQNLQGAVNSLTEGLKSIPKPDIAIFETNLAEQEAILLKAQQNWEQVDARLHQLEQVQHHLNELKKKHTKLDAEYAIYGTLSDIANGVAGQKVSLQRFVLSAILDDVLQQASIRLKHMSHGRYQLIRKTDKSKGNKASGLELEVDDVYTGKQRAVATLSGGESFMAALSLALGLSDVVQSYAGGIQLDALFIDEGFGSLDSEALQLAIQTLIDLQSTGRMIGIISHVSELKEQMHHRVEVQHARQGSHIQLITP